MSRIGVAKHLGVLEAAGLVVTRRRGREKLHYLNPVPCVRSTTAGSASTRSVGPPVSSASRANWSAPWRRSSRSTSAPPPSGCGRRSPTPGSMRSTTSARRSSRTGAPDRRTPRCSRSGRPARGGRDPRGEPPRRLVQSQRALWGPEVVAEGTTRITWEIEQVGDSCRLTVTHDQLRDGANDQLFGGWPMILSGLKTWLETGELLTTPGSIMYTSAWCAPGSVEHSLPPRPTRASRLGVLQRAPRSSTSV